MFSWLPLQLLSHWWSKILNYKILNCNYKIQNYNYKIQNYIHKLFKRATVGEKGSSKTMLAAVKATKESPSPKKTRECEEWSKVRSSCHKLRIFSFQILFVIVFLAILSVKNEMITIFYKKKTCRFEINFSSASAPLWPFFKILSKKAFSHSKYLSKWNMIQYVNISQIFEK